MDLHEQPKGERAKTRLLTLQLIELAIAAGWKPRECIAFAREAYKFVMSTLPEAADQQLAGGSKNGERIAGEDAAEQMAQPGTPTNERPKWGPDTATRRHALQALADQNLMMRDAAAILGVSQSVVASTAFKLKISFHGRRDKRRSPTATPKAGSKLRSGTPARPAINGAAVAKLPVPVDRGLKRRCPSCNQIFEPAEVSHYLCDDCEGGGHAGRS
jgi:hypothetical protein